MTTSGRVQVGTDQHTGPRGDLIPKDSGIMTENEVTGANGEGPEPPQEIYRKLDIPIENEIENNPDPKGDSIAKKQPRRERETDQTFVPIEDHTSLDPIGVTPSRRLRTTWEKRTHSNLHIQRKLESEGQERWQRTP